MNPFISFSDGLRMSLTVPDECACSWVGRGLFAELRRTSFVYFSGPVRNCSHGVSVGMVCAAGEGSCKLEVIISGQCYLCCCLW